MSSTSYLQGAIKRRIKVVRSSTSSKCALKYLPFSSSSRSGAASTASGFDNVRVQRSLLVHGEGRSDSRGSTTITSNSWWSPSGPRLAPRSHGPFFSYRCRRCFSTTNDDDDDDDTERLPITSMEAEENGDDELSPFTSMEAEEHDDDEVLPFTSMEAAERDDHDEDDYGEGEDEAAAAAAAAAGLFDTKNSPKYHLNHYYQNDHSIPKVAKHLKAESLLILREAKTQQEESSGGKRRAKFILWTATFECPVTGNKYEAGTLRNHQADSNADGGENEAASSEVDGKVYYRNKNTAFQAAAARTLDAIQYSKLGLVEPRLCREDPSSSPRHHKSDTTVSSATAAGAGTAPTNNVGVAPPPGSFRKTSESAGSVSDAVAGDSIKFLAAGLDSTLGVGEDMAVSSPSSDDPAEAWDSKVVEGGDEEYVVSYLPGSFGEPPSQRLLEALSSKSSGDPTATAFGSTQPQSERVPIALGVVSRLQLAVDMAASWATAVNKNRSPKRRTRNPHRLLLPQEASPTDLLTGRVLLAGLAEANQSIAITNFQYGVENAARQIINVLWQDESTYPDADIYSMYLKCLDGRDPLAVAKKAEKIVTAMRTRSEYEGRVLPEANIGTLNTLIQLWAQVGGTTGRYDRLPEDFQPNRESLLSVLSSSIYRPVFPEEAHGFDPDFSRECIERMREIANGDESLLPDTRMYNAPLRWSAGLLFRKSRPYARHVPWDYYSTIFSNGLKAPTEDTQALSEARAMDAWVDEMVQCREDRIAPDIESYESVIQAWLRTGTRDGLERAHELALSLLETHSDGPEPRLLTFRPVIVSWIHSKTVDGTSKVEDLVNRLERAGESTPKLKPDGRILQSLIASNLTRQLVIVGGPKVIDVALESARKCSSVMDRISHDFQLKVNSSQDVDLFIETTPFEETIYAWQDVASKALIHGNESAEETFVVAVDEMRRAVESFEKCLQAKQRSESPESLGLREPLRLSLQLRHFLDHSKRVYSAFIVGILHLAEKQRKESDSLGAAAKADNKSDLLINHTNMVESMLRRNAEFDSAFLHAMSSHEDDSSEEDTKSYLVDQATLPHGYRFSTRARITYEDYFASDTSPMALKRLGWNRSAFFRHVIDYLRAIDLEKVNVGDFVRICLLVKETCPSYQKSKVAAKVDGLLDQAMPFTRDLERRRVWRRQATGEPARGEDHTAASGGSGAKTRRPRCGGRPNKQSASGMRHPGSAGGSRRVVGQHS